MGVVTLSSGTDKSQQELYFSYNEIKLTIKDAQLSETALHGAL